VEVGLINIKTIAMKISVKHYDEKVTISSKRDDLKLNEFMDMFKRLAISIYSEELVENYWNS
jgi:hypothetical protein